MSALDAISCVVRIAGFKLTQSAAQHRHLIDVTRPAAGRVATKKVALHASHGKSSLNTHHHYTVFIFIHHFRFDHIRTKKASSFIVLCNQTLPEEEIEKGKKRHRSGSTHKVVQHPHQGLELCFTHFPLDLIVHRQPGFAHFLCQRFKLLFVQEDEVVYAAWTPQSIHLNKRTWEPNYYLKLREILLSVQLLIKCI